MEQKHYTSNHFKETMPEWKRKKDPWLMRYTYRPWSFHISAFCANNGISANTVSYIGVVIAFLACACFIPGTTAWQLTGAILFNVWCIGDCVDGNLARSVKKQPFGDFADSMSSYALVAFAGATMGYGVYLHGGVLFPAGQAWVVLVGAIGTTCDTFMRLVYQKYKANERALQDQGVLNVEYEARIDTNQSSSLRVKLEQDWGIGGYPCMLLIPATIFHAIDVMLIYFVLYYTGACAVTVLGLTRKAIKAQNTYTIEQ